jgi:hypothetical protein
MIWSTDTVREQDADNATAIVAADDSRVKRATHDEIPASPRRLIDWSRARNHSILGDGL